MEELVFIFIKGAVGQLGSQAVKAIINALMGESSPIDDVLHLTTAVQESIKELPQKVNQQIVEQRFYETLSTVLNTINHCTSEQDYIDLLTFLDHSSQTHTSYWGIVNAMCISMFEIDAGTMEKYRNSLTNIDFHQNGLVQQVSTDLLSKLQLTHDYMRQISSNSVTLSAAAVASAHVGAQALNKIKDCPQKWSDTYQKCMNRYNDSTTRKYLPLTSDGKLDKKGLPWLLRPAIFQAPRAIIGDETAKIFEDMRTDSGASVTPWSAYYYHDYKPNIKRYIKVSDRANPYLQEKTPVTWTFNSFTNHDKSERIYIHNGSNYLDWHGSGIRTNEHFGGSTFSYKWYIKRTEKYNLVHILRLAYDDDVFTNVIGVGRYFWGYYLYINEKLDDNVNYWYLY